jgi:hypothetical protein
MKSRAVKVIVRKRGTIPGCIPVGPDGHMAVDTLGRPWLEVAKLPSTVDAWLAAVAKQLRAQPISDVNRRSRTREPQYSLQPRA